jgi:hypothetical protein
MLDTWFCGHYVDMKKVGWVTGFYPSLLSVPLLNPLPVALTPFPPPPPPPFHLLYGGMVGGGGGGEGG